MKFIYLLLKFWTPLQMTNLLVNICVRRNCSLQHDLDEHTFLISTKKENKYMVNSMHLLFSVLSFTFPSNTHLNSNFKMMLDNPIMQVSHWNRYTLKCIVLVK